MKEQFKIAIADKNTHVRELIKRELGEEGYKVHPLKNCMEIIQLNSKYRNIDLLIIDPDLPDIDEFDLYQELNDMSLELPVIILTHFSDCMVHVPLVLGAEYIEKNASSIDHLKLIIKDKLKN